MARNERSAGFILFRRTPAGPATDPAAASSPSPASPSADGPLRPVDPSAVEYLLLDYGRHWDFAKGHVHKGETDLDAAVRELREETGIADARVVPGFRHEIVYSFRDRRHGLIRKTVIFFLAETMAADRDVMLSHEHVGYAFLPLEAAVGRVTFANARQVLRAAHAHLAGMSPGGTAGGTAAVPAPADPTPAGTDPQPATQCHGNPSE